jgi:hypothetical protein
VRQSWVQANKNLLIFNKKGSKAKKFAFEPFTTLKKSGIITIADFRAKFAKLGQN